MEGVTAYSASKAAVVGYTLSSAKELAPKGIRVNAIAPGFIDTDMVRGVAPDWYERRLQSIRMGRIGTPEDVAGVAVFLGVRSVALRDRPGDRRGRRHGVVIDAVLRAPG